ncbi:hypothetical protein BLNAU_9923 [Blattamonas nauphoetae]|uniref:Uncharacterized protein n=1 Tax=Blattamonas nauphoetae TaxID=2049346 RepID=A0ABQ9XUP0_9EUKA|nr:hypothetical protein BLNAU_9923 [Blattamonas nauphoetae]
MDVHSSACPTSPDLFIDIWYYSQASSCPNAQSITNTKPGRGDIRISYGLIQARRSDAHSKMEERIGLISRLLIQAYSLSELSGGIIPMAIKASTQRNLGVHKASSPLRNEENTVTHTELLLSSQQPRVTM